MKKMIEVFDTSKRVINFVGMFPLMTTISAIAVVASII